MTAWTYIPRLGRVLAFASVHVPQYMYYAYKYNAIIHTVHDEPGIGQNVSSALGDSLTSRPEGTT